MKKIKQLSIVILLITLTISGMSADILQDKADEIVVAKYNNKIITIFDVRIHLNTKYMALYDIKRVEQPKLKNIIKEIIKLNYIKEKLLDTDVVTTKEYKQKIEEYERNIALIIFKAKNNMSNDIYDFYNSYKKDYEIKAIKKAYTYDVMKSKKYFKELERNKKEIALDIKLKDLKISNEELNKKYKELKEDDLYELDWDYNKMRKDVIKKTKIDKYFLTENNGFFSTLKNSFDNYYNNLKIKYLF